MTTPARTGSSLALVRRRTLGELRRLPPAAGATVMATGIISVGLHLTGHAVLSEIALVVTATVWVLLALAFAVLLGTAPAAWRAAAARSPALTAVAATCVLGTRLSLSGWQIAPEALLALAALVWPWLLSTVLRSWQRRQPGSVFLVCVATQALAVLAGTLALAGHGAGWLEWAALIVCAFGIVLYAEALAHFDVCEVFTGAGDQWIAAGAAAISSVAASKLTSSHHWTGFVQQALQKASLILLTAALVICVVLAVAEIGRPRLRYDERRWSTVFPLGMSATAALTASQAVEVRWLHGIGTVVLWVAVGVWLLTAVGNASYWKRHREQAS